MEKISNRIPNLTNENKKEHRSFFNPERNDLNQSFFKSNETSKEKKTEQNFFEEADEKSTESPLSSRKSMENGEKVTEAKTTVASLSLSNNSYKDTASESRKNIKFNVKVPTGSSVGDYALVNWVKGYMKKGDGTYWKAKMYEKSVDANYTDYQVDSVDKDPVYWSDAASRWNFKKVGADGFYATDNPGPALNTETGAEYNLDFKIELYKLSDLPATTSGDIGTAKSKVIASQNWDYKVKVSDKGAFTH
jgi:hypothetical protein